MEHDPSEVTRSVDVEAAPDQVWEALSDPELRRAWLDDDDAADRELRIDRAETGSLLTWTWWHPGQATGASRVEIVLTELDTGGTRVAVTERLVAPPLHMDVRARASAWGSRLLGLELVLLAAGVCVG